MNAKAVTVNDLCDDIDAAVAQLPNSDRYRKVPAPHGKSPDVADLSRFVASLQSDEAILRQNVTSNDPDILKEIKRMEKEIEFCLAKQNQ